MDFVGWLVLFAFMLYVLREIMIKFWSFWLTVWRLIHNTRAIILHDERERERQRDSRRIKRPARPTVQPTESDGSDICIIVRNGMDMHKLCGAHFRTDEYEDSNRSLLNILLYTSGFSSLGFRCWGKEIISIWRGSCTSNGILSLLIFFVSSYSYGLIYTATSP